MLKLHQCRFDFISRVLHWAMALLIIYMIVAGYIMHLVPEQSNVFYFLSALNMSLATLAAPLLPIRFIWSKFRYTPNLPDTISKNQQSLANLVHSLIYLSMFVVFISGYLMIGEPYTFFWMVEINNVITDNSINTFFFNLHRVSCIFLLFLVSIHAAAALKHHFIAKNNVLKMMI